MNTDIAGASTNYLFNTGDAGDAIKTVGRLDIGDANNTHAFTIMPGSGAGVLNFAGSGANAQLNQLSTSKGDTISAVISNTTALDINNASANTLLFGTGAVALGTNTLTVNGGSVNFSSSPISGSGYVVVNSTGTVNFGPVGTGASASWTGGITLNSGTLQQAGSGGGDAGVPGVWGRGILTINGGSLQGGNNTGSALLLGGQVWNADWSFAGNKRVDLGTGGVSLGTTSGTTRTVSNLGSYSITIGGTISNGTTATSLAKAGIGTLVLNGSNTFTGGLALKAGAIILGNAFALGTGTFDIGDTNGSTAVTIDSSVANLVNGQNNVQNWNQDFSYVGTNLNLGNGPVTLVGNRQVSVTGSNLTVGGTIGGAYSLTKAGNGLLTLTGAVNQSGTVISGGNLQFGAGAVPGYGSVLITTGGTLNASGAYPNVAAWLSSGRIATNSSGVIGLMTDDSANLDFNAGSYGALRLGAVVNATYSGTLTPGVNGYQLGGGGATLTVSRALNANTNLTVAGNVILSATGGSLGAITLNSGALTLATANGSIGSITANGGTLTQNAPSGTMGPVTVNSGAAVTLAATNGSIGAVTVNGGTLVMSATNGSIGPVTVNSGTLTLTAPNGSASPATVNAGTLAVGGTNGSLTGAGITINTGVTLAFDSSISGVTGTTRAQDVTLAGGTLTVTGNAGANSVDTIGGALTVANGTATVTVTPNAAKNAQLLAGSLSRTGNGVALFRGTKLGVNTIVSQTANTANIGFSTSPTAQLVGAGGGAGSTTISILPWASGDTNAAGGGASLVTYDAANGLRPLNIATEYTTTITGGENAQNNVRLTTVVTNSVTSTINGLVMAAGSSIAGTGRLTVASGAILAAAGSQIGTTNAPGPGILDFGNAEGVISMAAGLTVVDAITGSGGLTKGGTSTLTLGGGYRDTATNTYSGTTTVMGGFVTLFKSNTVTAIPGDVVIYGGGLQEFGISGQISASCNLTIYNGSYYLGGNNTQQGASETVSNVFLLGNTASASVGAGSYGGSSVTVLGNTIVSNATLSATGKAAWWMTKGLSVWGQAGKTNITVGTTDNNGDAGVSNGVNGVTIYQPANGIFGVMNINCATSGRNANWYLYGDLVYNGNPANTNAATISSGGTYPNSCVLSINTNRTFTVNPGGGPVDLIVAPRISGGVYGITKAGAGTMVLTYTNSTYNGPTIVSAGSLLVNGLLIAASAVTNYATLGGTGTVNGAVNVIGGTLAPGYLGAGQMMLGSNLTLAAAGSTSATFKVELGGTSAGTGYDQLALSNKTARITLANASLNVALVNGFVPAAGNTFTIVDNQGTNAVTGTFAGLPEGRTFMIGQSKLGVSYVGGTGNDIVLTSYGTIPPGTVMLFR